MKREIALAIRRKIERAAESQSDEQALESIELFPKWGAGISVSIGERYQHVGKLWKVVQAHTTQAEWEPQNTPALWTEVTLDEWPEWRQPTGAQDAYNIGDKVTYEGRHYVSLIDGNVYSPAAYPAGWELKP
jgi:hypothetical protein